MPSTGAATKRQKTGSGAGRSGRPAAQPSTRGKRNEILAEAIEHFGQHGYEDTKWADVAASVGIGSTALYHYFESKLHCLYVIMADALEFFQRDFERITRTHDDYVKALLALLRSGYELSEHEVLRFRVLVAEQGLVGIRRSSPREEEARQLAVRAPATWSSPGPRSWSAGWSRVISPRPIRDCWPALCSAST